MRLCLFAHSPIVLFIFLFLQLLFFFQVFWYFTTAVFFLFVFAVVAISSKEQHQGQGAKKDPCWAYMTPTEIKGTNICKFWKEPIAGGVYRMKFHLAKILGKHVRSCPHIDVDVQRQINAYLETQSKIRLLKKRTKEHMVRPPSYPSSPHPSTRSPRFSSSSAHEEGIGSASAIVE